MAESGQQSDVPRAVRSTAPAPRKKITVSLTPAQAESLRALWQEHSAALHAMLTGWCGNAQNASDMLQELFRRLAESPSVLVRMKNTRAFLAVSARRIAVDFARRSATRISYQTAAGAEVPVVENPGPTDENLRAAIKSALEGLPPEQRVVFEHKVLNGRTLEEIARLEAISLNTAASRLRYALDKIRGQLRPYYDDLNRSQFKNMKNDLNQDLSANKRIITPLEPKRVPSVVPGFEGLAALSTDAGVSDAPTPELAECYALPVVEAPATDFVEPRVHVDPVFVEPPTGGIDPVPESLEEQATEENGDGAASEVPELISCEMFPTDGEIPAEWLRPFELPEEFMVTVFESEGETDVVDGSEEIAVEGEEGTFEVSEEVFVDGEGVPFDFESGFEICVLPVPEELSAEIDPREYLVRYDAFLADNPGFGALDPDVMEAQVITASNYFSELEFGSPSKAAAFDSWYEAHYGDVDGAGTVTDPDLSLDGSTGDFAGGTVITGGKILDGEIQPHWRSGDLSGPVYNLSSGGNGLVLGGGTTVSTGGTVVTGGSGLVLGGGTPATSSDAAGAGTLNTAGLSLDGRVGDFANGTIVNGGEVSSAGVLNTSDLSLDGRTGDFPGQTVITGGEVQIDPSLIWQFDPSRWEGTGLEARVAELMQTYDPAQSASEEVEAPVAGLREVDASGDSESVAAIEPTAQSAESDGGVAQTSTAQGPAAPSEVLDLPVEIAAAEIAGAESASGSGELISLASTPQQTASPESRVLSLDQSVAAQAGLAPYASAAAGGDFVADVAADASHDVFADAPAAQKNDSTTVAAGAVAVGGVAHGSGAAAAAVRKPLPQI